MNHDDFWFPDHLALASAHLERTGADLVFTEAVRFDTDGGFSLMGARREGLYDWTINAPATTWLAKRKMLQAIGGWRPARKLYNFPSQDLLYRAHRAGYVLRQIPATTVLLIPSGERKGSYLPTSGTEEHDAALEALLRDPESYRAELRRQARPIELALPRRLMNRAWFAVGIHPYAVANLVRHRRLGGRLNVLRRVRGLAALPELHE